jgi:hypothetical protein
MLHSGKVWPYWHMLDVAEKPCQGQTLQLIGTETKKNVFITQNQVDNTYPL